MFQGHAETLGHGKQLKLSQGLWDHSKGQGHSKCSKAMAKTLAIVNTSSSKSFKMLAKTVVTTAHVLGSQQSPQQR